ncbi:MAG: hypothetical protein LC768_11595 [Acidobacteria bacterium]|nr:hypothetical protein [Acidobacteriota bacterium]MCA1638953.1 hypothetical protein [Acidobacteriota bacterium]
MFPVSPIIIFVSLCIILLLGASLGLITGLVMNRQMPSSKSKVFIDLIFGVIGFSTGFLISAWASTHTFNPGLSREYFIWDENGRAIDWRTALADNQLLLSFCGAIFSVILLRVVVGTYKKRKQEILK